MAYAVVSYIKKTGGAAEGLLCPFFLTKNGTNFYISIILYAELLANFV